MADVSRPGDDADRGVDADAPVRARALVLVVLALALTAGLTGCVAVEFGGQSADPGARNATVTSVVDGDTIDVRFEDGSTDRVRLLGVDTPEVHVETSPAEYEGVPDTEAGRACLRSAGEDASAFVDQEVGGDRVEIDTDPVADRRGGYDRLLAYVLENGTSLNYVLVRDGYARVYDSEFQHADRFYEAEAAAQQAGRGVWACRSP